MLSSFTHAEDFDLFSLISCLLALVHIFRKKCFRGIQDTSKVLFTIL